MVLEERKRSALVLAGGGARGAYEVGVVQGILEALGLPERCPFQIFTGTSVGAINTAYFVSRAHRRDMGISRLVELWTGMTLLEDLEVDFVGAMGLDLPTWMRSQQPKVPAPAGPGMLRADPLEELIRHSMDWDQLHANIDSGLVEACVVAALRMDSGQTTLFAELASQSPFVPSRDPRRVVCPTRLGADHVLASAAIPLVFPPRLIGGRRYVDGGMRYNTPLGPALRCGAERVVIVSTHYIGAPPGEDAAPPHPELNAEPPSMSFLLGKLVDAVMLDPMEYDLQVLERVNRMIDIVHSISTPEQRVKLAQAMAEIRGQPYRRVRPLVFHPSEDIGAMANDYIKRHGLRVGEGLSARMKSRLLEWMVSGGSDLVSFLLFDGAFASELIALGRRDALKRQTVLRAFFDVL